MLFGQRPKLIIQSNALLLIIMKDSVFISLFVPRADNQTCLLSRTITHPNKLIKPIHCAKAIKWFYFIHIVANPVFSLLSKEIYTMLIFTLVVLFPQMCMQDLSSFFPLSNIVPINNLNFFPKWVTWSMPPPCPPRRPWNKLAEIWGAAIKSIKRTRMIHLKSIECMFGF